MDDEILRDDEPCYVISVAARLVSLHPQTLRYYDRIGLIRPSRTAGRMRLYSQRDIETLRKIVRLTEDLGVNLAGVEVVLNMSRRIEELQAEMARIQQQAEARIAALRQRIEEMENSGQVHRGEFRVLGPDQAEE
ncbi:MAG TPA: helix-turn-helix transcriptional regulator [Chloroflexi bacterium]|jgi:MerR family transcriptional regulator/heat shock protein HspR|nr:helix-turn-helix transcriptional regulator [Chloroflexota bacterium]